MEHESSFLQLTLGSHSLEKELNTSVTIEVWFIRSFIVVLARLFDDDENRSKLKNVSP